MSEAYRKIFWGVFIVNIHLHIGSITILPAFVGYLMACFGCADLEMEISTKGVNFPKRVLLALAVLSFFFSSFHYFTGVQYELFPSTKFLPILYALLEMIGFHKLIELSINEFQIHKADEKVNKYIHKDRIYICLKGVATGILTVSLVLGNSIMLIIGVILEVFIVLYLLSILHSLEIDTEEYKADFVSSRA